MSIVTSGWGGWGIETTAVLPLNLEVISEHDLTLRTELVEVELALSVDVEHSIAVVAVLDEVEMDLTVDDRIDIDVEVDNE